MTTVACGKCGRQGMPCQCSTADARGPLFGIAAGEYAKWSPKVAGEPLTMERIQGAWDRLERQRRSWTKRCPMCGPVPEGHCHWVSPELYRMFFDAETCEVRLKAYSVETTHLGMTVAKSAVEPA